MADGNATPRRPDQSFASFLASIIKRGENATEHAEQLATAVCYLERSMAQLRVSIAALRHEGSALAKDIASKLDADVHNDIDVAREIFQDWQRSHEEMNHG